MNEGLVILATALAFSPNAEDLTRPPARDHSDAITRSQIDGNGGSETRERQGDTENGGASGTPATTRSIWSSISSLGGASSDVLWSRVQEIRSRLPKPVAPATVAEVAGILDRQDLRTAAPEVRFAAAVLARRISRDAELIAQAHAILIGVAKEASSPNAKGIRLDAIRALGEARVLKDVYPALLAILESPETRDLPYVQIATMLALERLDSRTSPLPVLRLLRDESLSFDIRAEAALALAQIGNRDPLVDSFLRTLRREPSHRGELAQLLMSRGGDKASDVLEELDRLERENRELKRRLAKTEGAGNGPDAVQEIVALIRRHFVDPGQVDDETLAIAAFKALAEQLDHVHFYSPDDLARLRARSLGRHLGLGADFFKYDRGSPIVVARSFHPRRGILPDRRLAAGDRITGVDGMATRGVNPDAIRAILRSKSPGAVVQLEVERWGWEGPRWIPVELGSVDIPTVEAELFPANIAYVRITRFAEQTADDVGSAIAALQFESGQPLAGFILDLRDNSGGLLEEAVRVVDLFVDDRGRPIVTQVDRDNSTAQTYHPNDGRTLDCNMVVLVNGSTASSSEVVAGSLQDLDRARVVGRTTYGKGVSQQRYDTPESVDRRVGGKAAISLPNYYLELPSGRRFHRPRDARNRPIAGTTGGIVPDLVVSAFEDELDRDESEEFLRLQHSDELYRYVSASYRVLKAHWEEGPRDLLQPNNYPEFTEFYNSLGTTFDEERVRITIRTAFRRHLEDKQRRSLTSMIHEDPQLQRALLDLGIRRNSSPVYAKWLTESPDKEPRKTGEK